MQVFVAPSHVLLSMEVAAEEALNFFDGVNGVEEILGRAAARMLASCSRPSSPKGGLFAGKHTKT
jgi:hypothetical protein